jgi:ABC-type glycerol-3-phosphate transport system substrate-binding protein
LQDAPETTGNREKKMFLKKVVTAGALSLLATTSAMACEIGARVSIVGNEFAAIQAVGAGAQECTGASVETNLTSEHQTINVAGLSGNPSEYTSAIVANSSIVALMNEDVIRPLNDLVAKHGAGLQKSQLIKIGDDIMAVAFMANAQHLMYRKDILEQVGADVPTTYEEMLDVAEKIRAAGIMQNPIGGAICGRLEPCAGIQQHVLGL